MDTNQVTIEVRDSLFERRVSRRMFSCSCGKIHCVAGINPTSLCTCGINLWDQMFIMIGATP